jgi:hypothetical protein
MDTTELNELIDELIKHGEDRDELQYWKDIYPDLSEEEQQKILDSLKKELVELSAA